MAVECGGFSIREYVSEMRTVDAAKCWPFITADHHHHSDEVVANFLPPITVTKFKLWSHELQLARSRHEQDLSVRDNENKSDVDEKLDCCLGEERRRKKKAKAPKKRSIIEIFAVAPQVYKAADDQEEEEEEEEEDEEEEEEEEKGGGEGELDCKKKVTKKMKKKSKLKREKMKKLKREERKKNGSIAIANKEKLHKLKQQTSVNFNGILYHSSCTKRFLDDIFDSVSIRKKKPSLKCVSTQKKHKVVRTSKCVPKQHQKPLFPVRGILKSHTKVVSGKQSSTICNMQRHSEANPCSIQHSERHVRFSGKDKIHGPGRKHVSSIEWPKLQSISSSSLDAIAALSAKEHYMKSNRELAVTEFNGSDEDVSIGLENRSEVQPVIEKVHLSDSRDHNDMTNFLRPQIGSQEKVEHLSDKSYSLNQVGLDSGTSQAFDQGNPSILNNSSYASISRYLFSQNERYNSILDSQAGGNVSRDFNNSEKIIDRMGYPTPGVSATCSTSYMKVLPQPSSTCLAVSEIANERIPSTTTKNDNGLALQYQPFCHLSHKEVVGSLSSLPKQKEVVLGGKSMDADFCGWPLNSQGELIQLNSSGKGAFDQLKKAGMLTSSSSSLPMYNRVPSEGMGNFLNINERHCVEQTLPKDQFMFFPLPNYVKGDSDAHASSRFGVTETQGIRNTDIQWSHSKRGSDHSSSPWQSDLAMMNISFHDCKQYDQVQNRRGTELVELQESPKQMLSYTAQPTMRLMGKDVQVGNSSTNSQGFENGKVWTDKEIITEHRPISTISDNSVNRHFHPDWGLHAAMGQYKDPVPHSFDVRSSQFPQSLLQTKAPDSRFPHPYHNWQSNILSQNSSLTINGNPSSKFHAFPHPPTSSTLFNRAHNLVSGNGLLKVGSQILVPPSIPQNTCQHMHLNSAELNFKQSLPHATKSAFEFPFLYPDFREHIEPSWFQETPKSLPPWLLHATQEKETGITFSETYSDVSGKHHPCSMTGANFLHIPSVHHAPVVSYPYDPRTSHSHSQNSLGSASLAHPPLIPVLPGYKPTSAINMGFKDKSKVKDRMKSKSFPVRNLELVNKDRKRLAAKLDDSRRRSKIPNFGMQEDSSALTASKERGNSITEMQCNGGPFELHSNRDRASIIGCDPTETQKDGLRTSFEINNSKMDDTMKSGPLKLSAGAKHILKPCQSLDQDNSRPIHSTIPFAAPTSSGRVPQSQKSAKVYRF